MALPIGYKQVEYIQSSGTQYIDSGFKHNQNTRVMMKVKPISATDNAWAFEGRTSGTSSTKGVFFWYSSGQLWNADYDTANNTSGTRKAFAGIGTTDELNIDYNKNVCTINGVTNSFTARTFQSTYNLALLANNDAGNVRGFLTAKLYSCQIYDNGTLIRDFVPCTNVSGTAGLYDIVNSKFYGNSGSGSFTAGPVVNTAVFDIPGQENVGGVLKSFVDGYVNVGGVLKKLLYGYQNVGGVLVPLREIPDVPVVETCTVTINYKRHYAKQMTIDYQSANGSASTTLGTTSSYDGVIRTTNIECVIGTIIYITANFTTQPTVTGSLTVQSYETVSGGKKAGIFVNGGGTITATGVIV